ncbi:osmotically-inducible protein OsmY [Mucilaginibacter gracilis]|uniref:Osmotically-inducible protein OsmY n=1 Tax=Mucilaginibacter gracilis TaxID=423350 RepID=A0A495J6S5_9SPHI|nr:BON domain-containing protein [Mucilaginibacter gracilis]RKR84695.1 osmotically-inducible protein OsmY [Mucilaginibacter gracilis]
MKTNQELQKDVQDAIKWEPLLNAAEIGVTAKDGVVTLTGTVDSYAKKIEAEDATKNVAGVKAVAEEITIKYSDFGKKSDTEISNEVLKAWKWNWQIPEDKIKVKVENGWVTLEGELEWNYQKEAAKIAIRNLAGVMGVISNIKIKSDIHDGIEKAAIKSALQRNSSIDDLDINVDVTGNHVTLMGTVNSFYAKDEAEQIAWNAPGVWSVDNELIIEY